jgi:DNA-binding XRE family transcriptional regulator
MAAMGPQTAASRRLCSDHVFEFYRDRARSNPTASPLARARYAARWRQAELAETVGISRSLLSAYENGAMPYTEKTRIGLANALGVPVTELFTE